MLIMTNRKTPNFAYGNFATQKDLILVLKSSPTAHPNSFQELSLTLILNPI